MGCITGLVAKVFLLAFNVAVAVAGVAVLSLGAVLTAKLKTYGDQIPSDPFVVLDGLQSVAGFVICLGAFGLLTVCCCSNKLFLYSYSIVGACLVVVTLVFAGMGMAGINNEDYKTSIRTQMQASVDDYSFTASSNADNALNQVYKDNECCGVDTFADWGNKLPPGCCTDWDSTSSSKTCEPDGQTVAQSSNVYFAGCYTKLADDTAELAASTAKLSIFFGIFLLALLSSTLVCVKCTDAMPI